MSESYYSISLFASCVLFDIVVAGKLSIDELSFLGKASPPILGGSAAHVALAAATVGSRVAIVSAIGEDFPPEFLNILRKKGIDLSGVVQHQGLSARFSVDFATDGSMKSYGLQFGVGNRLSFQAFSRLSKQSSAIHLGILPPHIQRKLISRLPKTNQILSMTTIFHQVAQYRDRILPQLHHLDILFVNENEAQVLSGKSDSNQAIQTLGKITPIVVVTQGPKGCLINDGRTVFTIPSFNVSQVDATGAGDSFAGAFLASFLETKDIRLAAKWGNAAGALNCSALGCKQLISATRADFDQMISNMPENSGD